MATGGGIQIPGAGTPIAIGVMKTTKTITATTTAMSILNSVVSR
jgi:hypothetical protein